MPCFAFTIKLHGPRFHDDKHVLTAQCCVQSLDGLELENGIACWTQSMWQSLQCPCWAWTRICTVRCLCFCYWYFARISAGWLWIPTFVVVDFLAPQDKRHRFTVCSICLVSTAIMFCLLKFAYVPFAFNRRAEGSWKSRVAFEIVKCAMRHGNNIIAFSWRIHWWR